MLAGPGLSLCQVSLDCMSEENAGTGQCNNRNDELEHGTVLTQLIGVPIRKKDLRTKAQNRYRLFRQCFVAAENGFVQSNLDLNVVSSGAVTVEIHRIARALMLRLTFGRENQAGSLATGFGCRCAGRGRDVANRRELPHDRVKRRSLGNPGSNAALQ